MDSKQETRRRNLQQVCADMFNNDRSLMLASITSTGYRMSRSQLDKLLTESQSGQAITEDKARRIEKELSLESEFLDKVSHVKNKTYYVTVKVGGSHTYDIAKTIHTLKLPVVECSAVLGDFDLFLKIEVPGMHELEKVLDKLTRFPGILRTRTYHVVESIHWQKRQDEIPVEQMKNPSVFHNFAEEYRHQRILNHLDAMTALAGNEIRCNNNRSEQAIDIVELMENVKNEFLAIRLHDEKIENEKRYIEAEKALNKDKKGKSKRIIALPKNLLQLNEYDFDEVIKKGRALMDIGCQIRFLFDNDWVATDATNNPECFAIIDGEFVYVRRNDKESSVYTGEKQVRKYRQAFSRNWDIAMKLSEIEAFKQRHLASKF